MRPATVLVGLVMATGAWAHEPEPEPVDEWLPGQVPSAIGLGVGVTGIGIAVGGTALVFTGARRGEDGLDQVAGGVIAIAVGHLAVTVGAILVSAGAMLTLDLLAYRGADVDPIVPRVGLGFALAGGAIGLGAPLVSVFTGDAEGFGFAAGLGIAAACLVISYGLGTYAYAVGHRERGATLAVVPYITPEDRGLALTMRF